jgi:natural product precursor
MKKNELTKSELNELVGGSYFSANLKTDITNTNQYWGCKCTYSNGASSINNNNTVSGCACECI